MKQTTALIIGASVSGLACAACLQNKGIQYIVIEKEAEIAHTWRNHYERLHLHTNKDLSHLPYWKFGKGVPMYPSRLQVVNYLEDYQSAFNIRPFFNTEAKAIKKEKNFWITETTSGIFQSEYLIVATGAYGKPGTVSLKGMETFPGRILHSCAYKTGRHFQAQKVLVVGFGNSACEIAIDLYEQGAAPSMSVRSPVNILPRDFLGIPILRIGLFMSILPPKLADKILSPFMRLIFGDITKLGLKKKPYGIFEQIRKDGTIPLIDIGTIKQIRQGHIKIFSNIDYISGKTVSFIDGSREEFDAIVAAIGYTPGHPPFMDADKKRFEDLKFNIYKQKSFGKDGLYFCGFRIGPTGLIREIAFDAQKIAKNIAQKESSGKKEKDQE